MEYKACHSLVVRIPKHIQQLQHHKMMESCTDSPLSITGNILTILAFLLGLLASYLTFYTLTLNALTEIQTTKSDLEITSNNLESAFECCSDEVCLAPACTHGPDGALQRATSELKAAVDGIK